MYAWVMSSIDWKDIVFSLWDTRWWWNLESLKWESKAIWISDDYWAYKNAFDHHQLCWAHPIRKVRDLVNSTKLDNLKIWICKIAYEKLRDIHKKILEMIKNVSINIESRKEIENEFDEVWKFVEWEPEKLRKIKESLIKNKSKYFTCLDFPWIPTTNNTAERVLRPLVIKRKLCFWSKTSNWATMMEVIFSVVFSLLAKSKSMFFDRYLAI